MSALPKAVQAQLDQAEAIQAHLAGTAPEAGNPAPESVVEQPAEQVVPTEVQGTQVTQQAPSVDWEQRFRVLEGKYKAELPRLHEQNRELSERLDQAIKAMETKAQEPAPQESKLVTDADVEAYGADLVDMVRRASREEFDALAKKLVAELDKRFGQVAEKVAKTEERVVKSDTDKFWDEVYKAHADFDAVNSDERWFAFLDARIPGTRLTRRATAEQALSTLDSASINELLALFKASVAPAEEPVKAKSKQNLNAQVPPSSSKASSPSEPAQKVWTGAEYAAALDHRNLQRMSREDYERGVAEAEQALAEGRVQF